MRVPGLGHETKSAQRFEVFTDQLIKLGVPIIRIESGSMDPVEKNANITRDRLDEILGTGKSVIILAQSKGGTEAIEALAQLSRKLEGPGRPAGYGHVEAYMGMSGVYAPCFLVDWAGALPQWWFVRSKLRSSLENDGATVPTLDGFLDLMSVPMNRYAEGIERIGLPKSIVYLNVVGAVPGTGLAPDASVRQVQNDLIRPHMSGYGANDGYIEYPGTILPAAWAPDAYTVVVNGSHALVDGGFAGKNLVNAAEDREVGSALLMTLLDYVSRAKR